MQITDARAIANTNSQHLRTISSRYYVLFLTEWVSSPRGTRITSHFVP